jgi:hypothetical protein
VVAVTLQWPSVRGLSIDNIAGQLGCSPATINRACARFSEMAGLAGGVRFIRRGAGLNGDKSTSIQAQSDCHEKTCSRIYENVQFLAGECRRDQANKSDRPKHDAIISDFAGRSKIGFPRFALTFPGSSSWLVLTRD